MAKVLQWNCQSVRKKLTELEHHSKDFGIIILVETWCKPQDTLRLRDFDTVRSDRENQTGDGVAILARHSLRYTILNLTKICDNKLEVCGIKVTLNDRPLNIVSVYIPPDVRVSFDE